MSSYLRLALLLPPMSAGLCKMNVQLQIVPYNQHDAGKPAPSKERAFSIARSRDVPMYCSCAFRDGKATQVWRIGAFRMYLRIPLRILMRLRPWSIGSAWRWLRWAPLGRGLGGAPLRIEAGSFIQHCERRVLVGCSRIACHIAPRRSRRSAGRCFVLHVEAPRREICCCANIFLQAYHRVSDNYVYRP
jgi:hypothetical protein